GARVNAVITVDGKELARFFVPLDAKGAGAVRFQLPAHIEKGDGLLTLSVDAGGVTESMQRRIPIALPEMEIAAFPEGGDMVVGLPSRVYLSAHDKLGNPVEFEGDVVDDAGRAVAHAKSFYGGMARVTMKPEAGTHYHF